ncbi:hypothetical protein MAHJHV50_49520 [Mycobacterium avium subsp. hominissuis]
MKLKRKPIMAKYAEEIEQLYADPPPPEVHEPAGHAGCTAAAAGSCTSGGGGSA